MSHRQPTDLAIMYTTPLFFMKLLQARHSTARHKRIELWQERGARDLEAKVDSLEALAFPKWLVEECREQIEVEARWIRLFLEEEEEAEDSTHYMLIKRYETDIGHVREKLSRRASPGVPLPTLHIEEKGSPVCQEPKNPSHGVPGQPSRTPSPPKTLPGMPPQQPCLSVEDLHVKARRERIEQWNPDRVRAVKQHLESLSATGFPLWLLGECYHQINHEFDLVAVFKEEERRYLCALGKNDDKTHEYLDIIKKHEERFSELDDHLEDMCQKYLSDQLAHLLPLMREGGDWRKVIKYFVDQVKNLHAYNGRDDQVHAGLKVYKYMVAVGITDLHSELLGFGDFLAEQEQNLDENLA
ncbi:hypothetical protein H0H93_009256 [Arthromyces matolae]|nr:hypothetical protein H0H93_009256 [Arthromyces matolae]